MIKETWSGIPYQGENLETGGCPSTKVTWDDVIKLLKAMLKDEPKSVGWICPKCGRSVSPTVPICPCSEAITPYATWATSTSTQDKSEQYSGSTSTGAIKTKL